MHAWEAIQKTLDFIEENLDEPLEMEQLAKESSVSVFYYQRLFSRLVKRPVREYIRLRRLARACTLLTASKRRILDIALDCGFGSHETLTRAFKEAYKLTPEDYRRHPVLLNQFDKPDLSLHYTMVDEGVPLISDGIVLEFHRQTLPAPIHFTGFAGLVPIEGQLPPGEATGMDVPGSIWEKFHREKQSLSKHKGSRELGVAYLDDAPEGYFTYFAGTETAQEADDGRFAHWALPAGDYVVCGFEAENFEQLVSTALNTALRYSGLWLEKHGLTMDAYCPEMYYDSTPEGNYMELWLPILQKPRS